jgi:pimeloyl-ACP methyl ester carboxylesterase
MATTVGFYMFQGQVVFQGTTLEKNYEFSFKENFQEYFIPTGDGDTINAILFTAEQPAKGLILYFHGNKDNLQRWGQYAVDFTSLDYDIIMMDYRGYGKSTGTPDEDRLYRDANVLLQWSQENFKYPRWVFYGRSLGSAVASHLATEHTPDLLILETPFDEISGAMYAPMRFFVGMVPLDYRFPNNTFLPKITCRKVILHGTDDWVVPLSSALKLKPLLKTDDEFVIIDGGGHRNLRDFEVFHKTLAEALH